MEIPFYTKRKREKFLSNVPQSLEEMLRNIPGEVGKIRRVKNGSIISYTLEGANDYTIRIYAKQGEFPSGVSCIEADITFRDGKYAELILDDRTIDPDTQGIIYYGGLPELIKSLTKGAVGYPEAYIIENLAEDPRAWMEFKLKRFEDYLCKGKLASKCPIRLPEIRKYYWTHQSRCK